MQLLTLKTRDEWLAARSQTIGASDVARLLTDKMSPLFLWARLRGEVEDPFPELLGDHGLALEPVIRKWWLRMRSEELSAQGWVAEDPSPYRVLLSEHVAGLHASPDDLLRKLPGLGEGKLPVEMKTMDRLVANKLEEGKPEPYALFQNQAAQLACDGLAERGEVVYLIGNGYNGEDDLRIFEVPHDAEIQETIRETVERVWGHHLRDEPPLPDGLDDCKQALSRLYPVMAPKREGILPVSWRAQAQEHRRLGIEIDRLERQKKEISQLIEFEMGQRGLEAISIAASETDADPIRWVRYETKPSTYTTTRKGGVVCKPT